MLLLVDLPAGRDNWLHARNLREAAALHAQLARALAGAAPDGPLALLAAAVAAARGHRGGPAGGPGDPPAWECLAPAGGLPPPPAAVAERLRRAVAAGWADQVRLGA